MARKVKTFVATWNVGPDSKGPATVEVGGIAYRIGLATRHELACRGTAKAKCEDLVRVAWQFATARGKDMIWLEDLLSADVAIAQGVTPAKAEAATDAAIVKVTNEILTKTTVRADAQTTRRAHAAERRGFRTTAQKAKATTAQAKAKKGAAKKKA